MKQFVVLAISLLCSVLLSHGLVIKGTVLDENASPLGYPAVRISSKPIGALGDSLGSFVIDSKYIRQTDSLLISYVGYKTLTLPVANLNPTGNNSIFLNPEVVYLKDFTVSSHKAKRKVIGKKRSGALVKSSLDGNMAGECFGYEIHTKNGSQLLLDKVGFYYCDGKDVMTKMKFRLNVYDMSDVKNSPSANFKSILPSYIYFDFDINNSQKGKFEFSLSERIPLPQDAMVAIEFLENLDNNHLYFKSNLIGKSIWNKTVINGYWEKNPFASPFFLECLEVAE